MLKVLLPVDGSPSAFRATQTLIDTIGWYKEAPLIDLVAVHLPLPRVPNMGQFVSKEMVQKYYADESDAMLKPAASCSTPPASTTRSGSGTWPRPSSSARSKRSPT